MDNWRKCFTVFHPLLCYSTLILKTFVIVLDFISSKCHFAKLIKRKRFQELSQSLSTRALVLCSQTDLFSNASLK